MAFHDQLGVFVLSASLAAFAWLGLTVWTIVSARQPVRRRCIARAGTIGAGDRAGRPLREFAEARRPRLDQSGRAAVLACRERPKVGLARGRRLAGVVLPAFGGLRGGFDDRAWPALARPLGSGPIGRKTSAPLRGTLEFYKALPFSNERRRPALRVSERLRGPMLLGLFRPAVIIPRGMERPEGREQLRLCLLHELAHAESRDPLFGLIAGLAVRGLVFPTASLVDSGANEARSRISRGSSRGDHVRSVRYLRRVVGRPSRFGGVRAASGRATRREGSFLVEGGMDGRLGADEKGLDARALSVSGRIAPADLVARNARGVYGRRRLGGVNLIAEADTDDRRDLRRRCACCRSLA